MSPSTSSTPTYSPDPINDLGPSSSTPPEASLPPSNQQQRPCLAQQSLSPSPSLTAPSTTRSVKVERSSQAINSNIVAESEPVEEERFEDAEEDLGRSKEEEEREVEQVVASDDEEVDPPADTLEDELAVEQSDNDDSAEKEKEAEDEWKGLGPDWNEERLEDEMRPLDVDATFVEPLHQYQVRQEDVLQNYMRGMFGTMLRSEVWATTCLRKQSEAYARHLEESTTRIADEEVYQENMRQNLLRVKEQVQAAMEHLAGMQSLALVRVHQRSESAEPRNVNERARKKVRTQ